MDDKYVNFLREIHTTNLLNSQCHLLFNRILETQPRTIVELGSGTSLETKPFEVNFKSGGTSTRVFLIACHELNTNHSIPSYLFSIDKEPCKSTRNLIKKMELNNYWVFIQGNDLEVVKQWHKPIDFLFVDSDHSYSHVKKVLELWLPFVVQQGHVFLHDAFTEEYGVDEATRDFVKEHPEWKVIDHVDLQWMKELKR